MFEIFHTYDYAFYLGGLTCLIGALLGPLGFMLTLIVGFLEGGAEEKFTQVAPLAPAGTDWDPFA